MSCGVTERRENVAGGDGERVRKAVEATRAQKKRPAGSGALLDSC